MAKRIPARILSALLCLLLMLPVLPPMTADAASAGTGTHYSYTTKKGNSDHSMTALPNNLTYGANKDRTAAMRINSGWLFTPEGREYIPSWSMYAYVNYDKSRDPATQGDANHVGLPYRDFTFADSNGTTYYKTATADLEFELAEMPALDTTGLGAVNLSIVTAVDPTSYGATSVDYDRQLQVFVSTDGSTWLDGSAGVRSSTLLGGGEIRYKQDSTARIEGMFYRVETEDLLSSIPGLNAGDTIQKIKILPHGVEKRSSTWFTINNVDVNTWATASEFTSAVPTDVTYTTVASNVIRWSTVVEARRLLDITYNTTAPIYVSKAEGGGSTQLAEPGVTTYAKGSYTGPIYKRGVTATREALEYYTSTGTYTGPYGTLAADGKTVEVDNAIGMDCQTFVYNAISRVSRTNAWSVAASPMATYSSIPGGITTADYPAFTDIDIVNLNTQAQMNKNYAAAGAGDLLIVYRANYSNSVHTRLITRVDTAAQRIYYIDQSSGRTPCVQESYASFADLYTQKYVVVTLDEYAQGKLANADLEMVVGSVKDGVSFQTAGANVAVSSNYRINDYTVYIVDSNADEVWSSGKLLTYAYRTRAFNYQSDELNAALRSLPAGDYTLAVTANSGPYLNNSQTSAYHTVEQAFSVNPPSTTHAHSCDHGHASFGSSEGWIPLSTITDPAEDHPVLGSGNYYLDRNIDLGDYYLKIEGDVNLCLNGYTLTRTPTDPTSNANCWIFKVKDTNDGVTVTFNLCDCSAEQTGSVGNDWTAKNTTITDAVAIVRKDGVFNMYGGSITGSTTKNTVYVAAGGTFNLEGGSIIGNETTSMGAVNVASGGTFVANSGEISGNTVANGYNQVTGLAGATINSGAYVEGYHVHSCDSNHADLAEWGWTDLTRLINEATTTVILSDGYYYLSDDVDSPYQITVAGNVTLCLNGHTLSSSRTDGSYVFYINADNITFDLCDCSAEQTGTVGPFTSKKSSSTESAVIVRKAGTTFNLWSGTITGIEAGSVVYVAGGNTFNMYGGKITGNTTVSLESKKWGAVHVASGTFNMYDGAITGNTLNSGATTQVTSASSGTFNHEGGIVSAFYHEHDCGHGHSVSGEWKPLSSAMLSSGTTLQLVGGTNYYLDGDYAPSAAIVTASTATTPITLCLNGYTLSAANCPQLYFIRTNSATTLNICDCSEGETGKITGLNNTGTDNTKSAVILARASDVVNFYAGTITGNTAATVISAVSTFNLYGGKITGNTGNVSILYTNGSASKINIYDGSITDNKVSHATNGAVWLKAGTVTMTGGEIARNEVAGNQVTGATAGFTNNGGTVTEFVPTHTHADCTHGHEAITGEWLPLSSVTDGMTATTAIPEGNYFLDKDITLPAKFLQVPGTVNLCLNGHKLKGCTNQGYIIQITGGTLNICDCVGGGTIGEGWDGLTNTSTSAFCAIRVSQNGSSTVAGTLNLYAGSLTGVVESHGIVYLDATCTFNMYGGSITNNNSTLYSAVRMATASAKFNMTGGTVSGNVCARESNTQVGSPNGLGNINISGGTVVDTHTHSCGHSHNSFGAADSWKPLSYFIKSSGNTTLPSGSYYLDRDITLPSGYIAIDGSADVKLCLNGYNLNGVEGGSYIFFLGSTASSKNNTLTVCDCSEGEAGTLGDGWVGAVGAAETTNIRHLAVARIGAASSTGNTFNLYAGSITGVTAGSMVFVNSGNTFNMYGGSIVDNTVQGQGGTAVYTRGAVSISGGEIRSNTFAVTAQASNRGALAIDGGTATVTGGALHTPHSNQTLISGTAANTTVTGGKFSKAVKAELVPEGYLLVETDDETWGWVVVPELISGATVENGDTVDLKVSVDVSHLTDALNTYNVVMKKQGATDAATSEVTGSLDELLTQDPVTLTYYLTFPDVAAKEMGDQISVTVTDADGSVVTAQSFSAAEQFKAILNSTDDQNIKALCIDALHYGAAAQERFGYNTGALVNDGVAASTTQTPVWTNGLTVSTGHEALYAATATLKDKLVLNMYFNVALANVDSIEVSDGTQTLTHEVTSVSDEIIKVTAPGLAVKDAKTDITCTVTLTDDTVITVTDSLASYMARSSSERDQAVVEALMRYVESAIALALQGN